jgi:bile salt-stimulated lipase
VSSHLAFFPTDAAGLIHRAIMQSGSALCDWAIERSPLRFAQIVGESVGCPSSTTAQLVACLRMVSPTALLKAQSKVKVSEYAQLSGAVCGGN